MNGNSGQNAREPDSLDLWDGMNGEAVAFQSSFAEFEAFSQAYFGAKRHYVDVVAEAAQRRVRRIEDFRQSGNEGW